MKCDCPPVVCYLCRVPESALACSLQRPSPLHKSRRALGQRCGQTTSCDERPQPRSAVVAATNRHARDKDARNACPPNLLAELCDERASVLHHVRLNSCVWDAAVCQLLLHASRERTVCGAEHDNVVRSNSGVKLCRGCDSVVVASSECCEPPLNGVVDHPQRRWMSD